MCWTQRPNSKCTAVVRLEPSRWQWLSGVDIVTAWVLFVTRLCPLVQQARPLNPSFAAHPRPQQTSKSEGCIGQSGKTARSPTPKLEEGRTGRITHPVQGAKAHVGGKPGEPAPPTTRCSFQLHRTKDQVAACRGGALPELKAAPGKTG